MRVGLIAFLLSTQVAAADSLFEDMSANLPQHIYAGGWEHFVGGGVAVFDCNGDELPDLWAAGGSNPAILLVNKGGFAFESIRMKGVPDATGAYPVDLDADGILDLFVLRVGENIALKGDGSCGFQDATKAFGLPVTDTWSTAFTAWWEGIDPRPTLAIGNYVDRSDPDGPFEACDDNAILRPVADGYAREVLSPGFCPLSMLAARDARGRMALRISNDRHYYVTGGSEQMWDIDERRYLGEADGWPEVSLWGMGVASRDLDGDGRDEVMLTSMGDQVLQLAQSDGSYAAAPFDIGTYAQRPHTGGDGRPSTGWHAEFADINNDARPDLFIAKGNVDQMPGMATRDPNNLLMQMADGRFQERAQEAGVASTVRSRGAALADFDQDGRVDLVVVNRRAPMELYRNITEETGNWLRVDLRQAGGNSRAVGARVTVRTASHVQSIQQVIGGGHGGGQAIALHFGLGSAQQAEVSVTWPDGSVLTQILAAGQTHRLIKP